MSCIVLWRCPFVRPKLVRAITFYAPPCKWSGHIVLPSSVIPSFRHSVTILVSVHFLSEGLMDLNDIWYTDVSWGDAGQVRIWVWFDQY